METGKKALKIYIPEHVPSLNKGEEAIVQGILEGFRLCGIQPEISIYSHTPEIDRQRFAGSFNVVDGITFRPTKSDLIISRIISAVSIWGEHLLFLIFWRLFGKKALFFFRKSNWKSYAESDLILVGHDGAISDMNLLFAIYVKWLRKRSAIFGGGFRKFRFRLSEKIAAYALKNVDAVVVRQKASYEYLVSLGVKGKQVEWKPDPAFLLKPAEQKTVSRMIETENLTDIRAPLIGMVVVKGSIIFDKCFTAIPDIQEKYMAHVRFMAKICEQVIEYTNGKIVFLPHSIEPAGIFDYMSRDDRICARDVYAQMKKNRENVILIENEYNAATLKGFISSLDFIVSERLHSLIGAASVGTPFIAVTVEEDVRSQDIISETVGRKDLIFNINAPQIDQFMSLFKQKYEDRKQIRKELTRASDQISQNCLSAFRTFVNGIQ
ncbi:MAG: polysaccharide pyruvyl transferase family protein [Pseudomonadota bacterium]